MALLNPAGQCSNMVDLISRTQSRIHWVDQGATWFSLSGGEGWRQ